MKNKEELAHEYMHTKVELVFEEMATDMRRLHKRMVRDFWRFTLPMGIGAVLLTAPGFFLWMLMDKQVLPPFVGLTLSFPIGYGFGLATSKLYFDIVAFRAHNRSNEDWEAQQKKRLRDLENMHEDKPVSAPEEKPKN